MTLLHALILGIAQGLTEFLPVSSSAHLALIPWLFGWPDPGLGFDVALHFGTLAAVLWYFRAEWRKLGRAAWAILANRRIETKDERCVALLVVATIPGAMAGLVFQGQAENAFRDPRLTATALMIMGALLWLVDRRSAEGRALPQMRWRDAIGIGLSQMFAIIPGVSRSGSTMTAARALGISRESAAVFSFLMSMPIVAAAAVLEVPQVLIAEGITAPLVVGVLASALSGWIAIAVLLKFLTNHSFGVFAAYRILLGLAIWTLVHGS